MNGPQDLGGAHGFGPVMPEASEPVFHGAWEKRVFAMALAMGFTGTWNLDMSRAARESLAPVDYLGSDYYAIWLEALEAQIVGHGLAGRAEIAGGTSRAPAVALARVLVPEIVESRFSAGFPSDRPAPAVPVFAAGDEVMARNVHPTGHTRLPRYVRGRRGVIERVHDAYVFPDASAHGVEAPPQWLYAVGFAAAELWGESADPGGRVVIAAFESYLVPAGGAA